MAITLADFTKIWASTSPLTPYSFSESQYKEGWNFIGSTPPSRQMWDFLQKNNDEKMQYLLNNFDNYLPLSGGTVTGDLTVTGTLDGTASGNLPLSGGTMTGNTLITMGNGESYVRCWGNGMYLGGTYRDNASRLVLFTNSSANGFQLEAGDGTTFKRMDGKPDGTLTWDGQPLLPVGVVQAFAGTTIPNGWLLCDGSAVSRTTYANLYACIGTTYGAGDGSTTFNLPNLIDKFVEGSATAGTVKSAGLPNITGVAHALLGPNARIAWDAKDTTTGLTGPFYADGRSGNYASGGSTTGGETLPHHLHFDASRSSAVYGKSDTVQPPALTMRYIIKY